MPNVVIKFDGEEYRVPGPKGSEAEAYYTSDKQDAIGTARLMWKDPSLNPTFRRVQELTHASFQNGVTRAEKEIVNKLQNAQTTQEKDQLATCRQNLTKAANELSSAAGRVSDTKAKQALKKAEQLVDQARNILFDAQE